MTNRIRLATETYRGGAAWMAATSAAMTAQGSSRKQRLTRQEPNCRLPWRFRARRYPRAHNARTAVPAASAAASIPHAHR
jgi:hypothetical protein